MRICTVRLFRSLSSHTSWINIRTTFFAVFLFRRLGTPETGQVARKLPQSRAIFFGDAHRRLLRSRGVLLALRLEIPEFILPVSLKIGSNQAMGGIDLFIAATCKRSLVLGLLYPLTPLFPYFLRAALELIDRGQSRFTAQRPNRLQDSLRHPGIYARGRDHITEDFFRQGRLLPALVEWILPAC